MSNLLGTVVRENIVLEIKKLGQNYDQLSVVCRYILITENDDICKQITIPIELI